MFEDERLLSTDSVTKPHKEHDDAAYQGKIDGGSNIARLAYLISSLAAGRRL